ncbi:hypothetical protein M9Y10_045242 [Tritrichomonas musculus]|uniref:Uncharacterized protein n=1 Tax=Tritrichomonas musculus TaxID=1915356 RepID=A0ABR2JUQ1_9EUKA
MSIDQIILAACYDLKIYEIDPSTWIVYDQYEISNSQVNRILTQDSKFYVAAYSYLFTYDTNSQNKKPVHSIAAHESNVTDIALSSTYLISCGEDKLIKVWDQRTVQPQSTINAKESLYAIDILKNNYQIIVGSESGNVSIFDLRNSNNLFKVAPIKSPVRSISMNPNGESFIVGHMDGTLFQYKINNEDSKNITENFKINTNSEILLRAATSPDGKLFATCGGESSAKIWNYEDGTLMQTLSNQSDKQSEWMWDLTFSTDSKCLCTACSTGDCSVWDNETGLMVSKIPPFEKCLSAIALITV